jgi:hypothetical protein
VTDSGGAINEQGQQIPTCGPFRASRDGTQSCRGRYIASVTLRRNLC